MTAPHEPTGSVDVKTGAYILDMFRDINRGTELTVVIVTHDPNISRKVARVVSIRDGKISSKWLLKQSYRERLERLAATMDTEPTQDEFTVLDRAGRLQIPRELLAKMSLSGNKVHMVNACIDPGRMQLRITKGCAAAGYFALTMVERVV